MGDLGLGKPLAEGCWSHLLFPAKVHVTHTGLITATSGFGHMIELPALNELLHTRWATAGGCAWGWHTANTRWITLGEASGKAEGTSDLW